MKTIAHRIGLNRVAAILVGCALVLEIIRVQVVSSTAATVACTVGEVAFLALAVLAFIIARREHPRA